MSATAETHAELRTFYDLRRFAAETPAAETPAAGDAFVAARRRLPMADGAVGVFLVRLPAGSGAVEALAADEFAIVLEGEIALTSDDGIPHPFGEDASFVLTKGARFAWSAARDTTLVVVSYPGGGADVGGGEAPAIVAIDRAAALTASKPPLAELLVGETPSCRSHTDYLSGDGEFVCGVWDSTPYFRKSMLYRHHELMHLLEGSVTFVDESGRSQTFAKGDVFFVEAGAHCSWDSREPVAKVYAIHRPA
ncbi:cupin domain-containing protein [Aureimonas sp. AU12]|uniref:cupin domain-containing protein n=1 Tax=Aureimonas sp. AU12 TaxID=1638161 RepID=UPI000783B360|nr:cupin domain-containing protein [Aureimonas sp. AU12]